MDHGFTISGTARLAIVLAGFAGACATLRDGTQHMLAVQTPGVTGATCYIKRGDQQLGAIMTPGRLEVGRSRHELEVTCQAPGHEQAQIKVASVWADSAKLQMPEGYVVDYATGAMWTYPASITVTMNRIPAAPTTPGRSRRVS